ncbi:MAG: hypothetical protein DI535_13490 [Citrobacter freundii]|nr:MAG: hypothetical protein DI535_13490 [Citrobacter freundii]
MATKIKLEIASPCSENWDKMDRTERGRFCQSCQKQVIDFTGMSDQQLALFFKHNKTNVCGRTRNDQLGQELELPRKRIHWFRYFVQVALPALIFSNKGYTQGKITPLPKMERFIRGPQDTSKIIVPAVDSTPVSRIINGRVIDRSGIQLSGASIMIRGTTKGTAANEHGQFSLRITDEEIITYLEISAVGYVRRTIEIKQHELFNSEIVLDEATGVLGEIVVFVAGGITAVPVDKPKKTKDKPATIQPAASIQPNIDAAGKTLNLYPNPVTRGTKVIVEIDIKEPHSFRVNLTNLSGAVLSTNPYKPVKGINRVEVPIANELATGIYFIQVISGNGEVLKQDKLIIQ